jgi:transposase InsO family protein
VMTDNGNPYRSRAFPAELKRRGIRHNRTRPYTPRTNGKAEAMVKMLLNSWAYTKASVGPGPLGRAAPVRRLLQSRTSARRG